MEPMGTLTCPAGPMSFPHQSPMECTPALLATPIHRPHLVSVVCCPASASPPTHLPHLQVAEGRCALSPALDITDIGEFREHPGRGPRQAPPKSSLLRNQAGCSLSVALFPSRVLSRTSHDGWGHGIRTATTTTLSWAHGASSQRPQCPLHSCR